MKIKEIFERDIFRNINPAVVVSNNKQETIDAEIREYVFTDDLIEKIFTMVDTVLNKKSGKSGIWINGYYGSGKSHFIKFVHYLLDAKTSETAFEVYLKAVEGYDSMKVGANDKITVNNISLLRKRIASSHCDNIMFNVEDETDDVSQERLTRIFINMFNKFRGYNSDDIPLALLLEKRLDQKGVFEDFKQKINEELGFDWEKDAADAASFELESVLRVAKSLYPDLDTVALHGKLSNPDTYKIGINSVLIPELQSFLNSKDANYRLLFLVDEVSQYVGANKEILLNFQNIIERVSDDCNNQIWIACTAQQTLDEVSSGTDGVMDVQDEFGKILGRFDTRISLQSNDSAYITQKRVLDKNSQGIGLLEDIYHKNQDYIEHQFKINHELYKGFKDTDEFLISYPFVPYQFKLIAHVFEAFQQLKFVIKEVKDNERSVLGITHFTAKEHAEDEVGGFISFDAFYNSQFSTNLTNRGAKAIQNGLELPYVKNNPFAQKVVKVLFMISNLLEIQRQTFPSNLDNITVLLMDKLDQNKAQLQKDIKEVLDKLCDESIIREEKESYFFFNEDEMDVQNIVKNQVLSMEDRWKEFDAIIREMLGIQGKVNFGQNTFKLAYSIGSKEFIPKGDIGVKILLMDTTDIAQKALSAHRTDMVICLNEWFNQDSVLRKDFDWYCQTNKYFLSNPGSTGERGKTNENFKLRNRLLKKRIIEVVESKFPETRIISQQNIIDSSDISGARPKERFDNMLNRHLSSIYDKHDLCATYAKNQQELKQSAADKQQLVSLLSPAEQLVDTMITANNGQMTVHDLINNFADSPFGWKHEAVLDILVHLVKKKKREFQYKSQPRYDIVDFINKAVNSAERLSCEVITGEDIDQSVLDNTIQAYNNIFNQNIGATTDGNDLFKKLQDDINAQSGVFQNQEAKYRSYPFGLPFSNCTSLLNTWSTKRDPKKLFDEIIEGEEQAKSTVDLARKIGDFLERAFADYKEIKSFVESNGENFKELSKEDQEKGETLKEFLKETDITTKFRHAKKAYEELKDAINLKVEELKGKVKSKYESIFEELEKQAEIKNCPADKYARKSYIISGIETLGNITSLKNKSLSANDFRSNELSKILNYAPEGKVAETTQEYRVATSSISIIKNEQQLEQFLSETKEKMQKLLAENKTIILK